MYSKVIQGCVYVYIYNHVYRTNIFTSKCRGLKPPSAPSPTRLPFPCVFKEKRKCKENCFNSAELEMIKSWQMCHNYDR